MNYEIRKSTARTEHTWLGQRGWTQSHHLDSRTIGLRIDVHRWLEDGRQGNAGEVTVQLSEGDFWHGRDRAVSFGGYVLYDPTDEEIDEAIARLLLDGATRLPLNAEQVQAVRETMGNYRAHPDVRLVGWRPTIGDEPGERNQDSEVNVEFTYAYLAEVNRLGREVAVYGRAGEVISAQDFG